MAEPGVLERAEERLRVALEGLETVINRRIEEMNSVGGLRDEVHALAEDRAHMAADLDTAVARATVLEEANRQAIRRIDGAHGYRAHRAFAQGGLRSMPEITVTIAGRPYRMACGEGEEQHLAELAADFDRRITALKQHFGEVGDNRLLIMAALTVAR